MLKYLKSEGIVHRDIKLENIFFNERSGIITVGDIGSGVYIDQVTVDTPIIGTRGHQGLELL